MEMVRLRKGFLGKKKYPELGIFQKTSPQPSPSGEGAYAVGKLNIGVRLNGACAVITSNSAPITLTVMGIFGVKERKVKGEERFFGLES